MKVLQINSVCGYGSTGRIATDIADLLVEQGDECRIAYGRGEVPERYQGIAVKIGSDLDNMAHCVRTRLLDQHGFGSKSATRMLLKWVEKYDPDLIHLHNIHGYYMNIELLFAYLKKCGKPVVWTLHDCWSFTGHCSYFDFIGCDRWKTGCFSCPQKRKYPGSILLDRCRSNYAKKRSLFTGISNMTLVTPSKWLASIVEESFLGEYKVCPIYNGLDLNQFHPINSDFRKKHDLEDKRIILGVANVWEERKGLDDFVQLSHMIPDPWRIVLVGLNEKQIQSLPENIVRLPRTKCIPELAEIYSAADVYVNPSVEETMGLTTVEALACGTPVITYNKTAVPEVVDDTCGYTVACRPEEILQKLCNLKFDKEACIARAACYEKKNQYRMYIDLYRNLMKQS